METPGQKPELPKLPNTPEIHPDIPVDPKLPPNPEITPLRDPVPSQPAEVPTPDTGHPTGPIS